MVPQFYSNPCVWVAQECTVKLWQMWNTCKNNWVFSIFNSFPLTQWYHQQRILYHVIRYFIKNGPRCWSCKRHIYSFRHGNDWYLCPVDDFVSLSNSWPVDSFVMKEGFQYFNAVQESVVKLLQTCGIRRCSRRVNAYHPYFLISYDIFEVVLGETWKSLQCRRKCIRIVC